ncbi:MAG TPA: hypothetical protein ENI82_02635 [Bacteroidetes bacterium]|nr:hypothetical protein [Bacteroidota bacterium]
MKTLNLSILIVISFLLLFCQCKTNRLAKEDTFFLEYDSPTEKITIQNNTFSHRHIQNYFAPQSVSSIPDSSSTIVLHEKTKIPKREMIVLKEMIENNNFYQLKDAYGANLSERHYPYELKISIDQKSKTVIIRSNPHYEDIPKAFSLIENKILDLSDQLRKE